MKNDKGFVLATGVIFLMIITMIVLYLFRGAILEEGMTRNTIARQKSMQAAESALRDGEQFINAGGQPFEPFKAGMFTSTCTNGLCRGLNNQWKSLTWTAGRESTAYSDSELVADVLPQKPRYFIELVQASVWTAAEGCSRATYRVIAKGWANSSSETVVQSHFQHRPSECRN